MLRRYGLLLLLLLTASPVLAQSIPAKGDPATLDVATWNIEWFGSSSQNPFDDDLQRANVRAVIEQADIDLWALQEIADPNDFDVLLTELGAAYDGILATNSTQQRVGFLWKVGLLSNLRVGHILEDFEREFAFRPPLQLEADINLPDTTVEVAFITVHMKAFSDADSYNRRVAASQQLKNYIDFLRPGDPIVVLGDLNDELGQSIYAGRTSPYQNFLDDADDYHFATLELDQAGLATFCRSGLCSSGSTLDHILITDELFADYVTGSADRFLELTTSIDRYVSTTSDHLPVFARFLFDDTGVSAELPDTTPGLAVTAAYPNPFQQRTAVTYTLPQPGPVRLEAFDLLGRRVAVLADGTQPAGRHRATFDASRLPRGIYLLRFTAGDAVHTQRVVRLR